MSDELDLRALGVYFVEPGTTKVSPVLDLLRDVGCQLGHEDVGLHATIPPIRT